MEAFLGKHVNLIRLHDHLDFLDIDRVQSDYHVYFDRHLRMIQDGAHPHFDTEAQFKKAARMEKDRVTGFQVHELSNTGFGQHYDCQVVFANHNHWWMVAPSMNAVYALMEYLSRNN